MREPHRPQRDAGPARNIRVTSAALWRRPSGDKLFFVSFPPERLIAGGCGLPTALHAIERAAITLGDIVAVQGSGPDQISYAGHWTHTQGSSIIGSFAGTVSTSSGRGASATLRFTGTQVRLYTAEASDHGIMAVSLDNGPQVLIDTYAANETGDVLVYTSPTLTPGSHVLTIRATNAHDVASFGKKTSIDRFDISP